MKKEEVLLRAQSRKENEMDEMELDILNKGYRTGFIIGLIICLLIMGVKIMADIPYQDTFAVYSFMVGGQWIYKWVRLKGKHDLALGILWLLTGGVLLLAYLTELF